MKQVTLITGKNNAGKTAALESLFIFSGHRNPTLVMVVNAIRGINKFKVDTWTQSEPPWLSVFGSYDDTRPVVLEAEVRYGHDKYDHKTMKISSVKSHTELSGLSAYVRNLVAPGGLSTKVMKVEYEERRGKFDKHFLYFDGQQPVVLPPVPMVVDMTRFLSAHQKTTSEELALWYGQLQLRGETELLLKALQEIEPRLKELELVFSSEPIIHGDIGLATRRLLPLAVMGDGVVRVATLILAMGSAPGGAILVDDIDTGLHHSVMSKVWAAIFKAAELFDSQVIATTHSDECVGAALSASKATGAQSTLGLVRLERRNGKVAANTFDSEELEAAFGSELEVR